MTIRPLSGTLVRLGPERPATRRLFCLPYAGGGVAAYAQWWRTLPDDVAVFGVQLPGRETRVNEPPLTTIAGMADLALAAVRDAADLPYAVFGHSMGALVAFELTLRIEADGMMRPPSHLFLSGRRAPGRREPVPDMLAMSDGDFLDALAERFGAVSDAVRAEPELLAMLLPMLRADVQAVESYRAPVGPAVRCAVDVCGGASDAHPTPGELADWQRWVEQPMGIRVFEGDHFYLAPAREVLTGWLASTWR